MAFYSHISGYSICVSYHAQQRIVERFKALSISYKNDGDYITLGISALKQALENPFMYRYLANAMRSYREFIDVLIYDTPNKMVYAITLKPYDNTIIFKTIGCTYDDEWMYYNKKRQRICWIYDNAFKFSTNNGNVTWF